MKPFDLPSEARVTEISFPTRIVLGAGALARLPAEQREALELAYYGGLSQSELAERLGVPLGTVKSRMFAALSKLRDLLGDEI